MNSYCLAPLMLLGVTACMTTPAPSPSTIPPSAAGPFGQFAVASITPVPDNWWHLYDDRQLDRLVEASLAANADLRVAYANLDAARAAFSQAQAVRLPTTTVESSLTLDNPSNQPGAASLSTSKWDVAATAGWDIDLFGRLRSGALAARADAEAQAAALDAVKVAVVADTVQAYVELCGASRALEEAKAVSHTQDRSVLLVREQLAAGEVSQLEVAQTASLAASTRATIAPFEALRINALYRLATLQGRPPVDARSFDISCTVMPRLKSAAPVGDGTALLVRRPDVREAERKLAAAAARVGVARADFYPRVNLGGALGLLAGRFDAVATPLISWAFPNQVSARAELEQAQAGERAALASWDAAILKALREVETGLASYDAEVRRNRDLADAAVAAEAYARRAAARVRLGDAASLLQVDANRAFAGARLATVQSDISLGQAEVALFRALGGGWRNGPETR